MVMDNPHIAKQIVSLFGERKYCRVFIYNPWSEEVHKPFLYVEREEDMYALQSPQLKDKRVTVVKREDFILAEDTIRATVTVKADVLNEAVSKPLIDSLSNIKRSNQ
jgi:hypothetical protein